MSDTTRDDEQPTGAGDTTSDGLGEDGTIPADPRGVAAGHAPEKNTFEPEEVDDTQD